MHQTQWQFGNLAKVMPTQWPQNILRSFTFDRWNIQETFQYAYHYTYLLERAWKSLSNNIFRLAKIVLSELFLWAEQSDRYESGLLSLGLFLSSRNRAFISPCFQMRASSLLYQCFFLFLLPYHALILCSPHRWCG